MQKTENLQEVCQIYVSFEKCEILKYMELIYLLKALEDQFSVSSNLDLVVQDLNQKWNNVCSFIDSTGRKPKGRKPKRTWREIWESFGIVV